MSWQVCAEMDKNALFLSKVYSMFSLVCYVLPGTFMLSLGCSCSPWCVHVLPGTFMLSLGYSCSPWDVHALLGTFMWATNPKRHRTFSHATLLLPKSFSNSKALQWVRLLLYPKTQRLRQTGLVCRVSSNRRVSSTPAEAWLISPRVISRLLVLLLQIAERDDQPIDEQREDLVERVHEAALHPLGDGDSRVGEAQLLQDVVGPYRVDLRAGPVEESASRS